MTWILFSRSIRPSPLLADPLHVALDRNLAHWHHLAALDHHEPRPIRRPMVLAGIGERRGQAPRVELFQALQGPLDRLPGRSIPGPLDPLDGHDDPQPPPHVGRSVSVAPVMLLVEV